MASNKNYSSEPPHLQETTDRSIRSNLESFACLWLDQNVRFTQYHRDTLQELRQVINHLQTFHDSNECEQYIRQTTKEKVILIVSGTLGRQVVPRLHDLPQFSACYVFCQDEKANKQWATKYSKVNGVFIDRTKLVTQICKDQAARAKVEDGASISVISSGTQSLQARNAISMWFQLFIEVLLRMHHKSTDRKELLDICKQNYKGNYQEMEIIDEFEKKYKAENAIWWYTRDACFYRMMNKALRVQDFGMLFAFRFFIADIAKQLKYQYKKFIRTSDSRSMIRVYRGQVIGIDELELMKNRIGQYLSMNSFLSTSRDRTSALDFAEQSPAVNGTQPILFEIDIDPRLETTAFADVGSVSYFQSEGEVLIMLGALFRIEEVIKEQKSQMWVVRVSLASEDDFYLKEIFGYMKQMIGDDTDLDSLGKILHEMGEYQQAQKCYERMMRDSQVTTANCHLGLGKALEWQKESRLAVHHYDQAMKVRKEVLGLEDESVGEVYSYIGGLQWCLLHKYDEALINLTKALSIQEKVLLSNPLKVARTYNEIAATYNLMGEYDLALTFFNKCLKIRQALLPSEHPHIATLYNNIGTTYMSKRDYTKALEYFEKSLSIAYKTLPPTHGDISGTENNIRKLKRKMKKECSALNNWRIIQS